MTFHENVILAPFTTFHLGGPARFFGVAHTESDLIEAIACAKEHHLPLRIIGEGSNVLIPDGGVNAVVVRQALRSCTFEEGETQVVMRGGAGMRWESMVDSALERGLWGIENLAGIPGSVGGALVQNIGAYGAEFKEVFVEARVIDSRSGERRTVSSEEAGLAYRSSLFKKHPHLIIVEVAIRLSREGSPRCTYPDVAAAARARDLTSSREVATMIRDIRAAKFPHDAHEGTAGSFFKNPTLPAEQSALLVAQYPGLPAYPQPDGRVKVSLAWILDQVLHLKGYAEGNVRLYEKQPLVVVARSGATTREVEQFVAQIVQRVYDTTHIRVESEVELFTASHDEHSV